MRNMVKLGFIAFVLFLLSSCSNNFPPAPEMKFCMLEKENKDGETVKCYYSIHVFPEKDCGKVGGTIVSETEGEEIPDVCKKD